MEMGKNNKKVIFLLAGWYNKLWMFWIFSKILSINGYRCITYAYDGDVFSPDVEKTSIYIKEIQGDLLKRITQLKQEGCKDFSIFGTSLGSMIALMVADKTSDVSKVILNTTGIDVAEAVWSWDNINPTFKEELVKQKLTLPKLKTLWNDIPPASNIANLGNKKILIYLTEIDEVIPFNLGKSIVKEFNERKYNYTLITNKHLKHLYAGAYNLFNAKVYLNFLRAS